MKSIAAAFLVILTLLSCSTSEHPGKLAPSDQLYKAVNPFVGTGAHGHTYPGAVQPFGMVQLSPDTRLTGWDGCSGYHYTDSHIHGFSHTHLSGTGIADYCDILLMPTREDDSCLKLMEDGRRAYGSPFQKSKEDARAGTYQVYLDKPQVDVELAAGLRTGRHRYSYHGEGAKRLVIDLIHRDEVLMSSLHWVDSMTLRGKRISRSWADEQHVYFYIKFSEPIRSIATLSDQKLAAGNQIDGKEILVLLEFAADLATLECTVSLSHTDLDGAKKNLLAEAQPADYDSYSAVAQMNWHKQLSKIQIETDDHDLQRKFYTALYHACLAPHTASDVDGRYRGLDQKVHRHPNDTRYTVYSLWDTYRSTHPLYTLMEPERVEEFCHDFAQMYEESNDMAMWELAANETYCMIGYHSVPVIVDAYFKGLFKEDPQKMVEAMAAAARLERNHRSAYAQMGFLSSEICGASVSQTLEYAFDDWCIYQMAKDLDMDEIAKEFAGRSQSHLQLIHPEDKMIRPKNRGFFIEPYEPREVNFHYTEANGWQYNFYYPQDISQVIELHGGANAYEQRLDSFFTMSSDMTGNHQSDITGLVGQYAHGNEPSHHAAFLYHFVNKPHKSTKYVHKILHELYSDTPEGICGNEDCGQMSAWFVLSSIGLYPFNPADGNYLLVEPIVQEAKLMMAEGRIMTITKQGDGAYVEAVHWNGEALPSSQIAHNKLKYGGTLTFMMGDDPAVWPESITVPSTPTIDHALTPVPAIVAGERSFFDSTKIKLAALGDAEIRYTLDGSDPMRGELYTTPLHIAKSCTIRAIAKQSDKPWSREIKSKLHLIQEQKEIDIKNAYAVQYAAGGDHALINGLEGGQDYRSGEWQGYEGADLEAIITLPESRNVKKIHTSFLQDQNSWIFQPLSVSYYASADGKDFQLIGKLDHDIDPFEDGTIIADYDLALNQKVKAIKVVADNRGICPEGHKGDGGKCWIFIDEIFID